MVVFTPSPEYGPHGFRNAQDIASVPDMVALHSRGTSMGGRRTYPRVTVGDRSKYFKSRALSEDVFAGFRRETIPTLEETKENVFEKSTVDPFRHDVQFSAGHLSILPPEDKLELAFKDRRARPLPSSLRPAALDVLEKPLRCLERTGRAPPGLPSWQFYDGLAARAPPQPVPAIKQKHETEFLETIEKAMQEGQIQAVKWDQFAKTAEELLITMSLDKVLRCLKAFVQARYRGAGIYTQIGGELAKDVKNAPSSRLCQAIHWLSRAGLRDQTLMSLIGNEMLFRLSDDIVLDMYIEVLNVHAKLDIRNPRLVSAMLREMMSVFCDLTRDQCCAVSPLAVMNVFSEPARHAFLSRCAELGMGLPAQMPKPSVLRQFRLLEHCLRLDYRPTTLPNAVQLWLTSLRSEANALDKVEATPPSLVEQDIERVLREEMDIAVTPVIQDGIFTLHLVMGKVAIELIDSYSDYYVTPAMGGQRLLRAETKLRQRLLRRSGWRLLILEEDDWRKLTDDLYKKDLLGDLLVSGGSRRSNAGTFETTLRGRMSPCSKTT